MSGVKLPVSRPTGRALLVGNPGSRQPVLQTLQRLGYETTEYDDPYAAMYETCQRPQVYRAVILSLAGLYREELGIISAIKRQYPRVEVWLTHIEGRQAALAEAMRLGADGLLADDGLHRMALTGAAAPASADSPAQTTVHAPDSDQMTIEPAMEHDADEPGLAPQEPLLSADELRALLAEQPLMPPAAEDA